MEEETAIESTEDDLTRSVGVEESNKDDLTRSVGVEESKGSFSQVKVWAKLELKTDNLGKKIDEIDKKINRFDDKIEDSNLKTVETLGIFVALFTFVSVDIQIFKSQIDILSAAGFTIMMLGGLLLFILVLVYILNISKGKKNKEKLPDYIFYSTIVSVTLLVLGVILVGCDFVGVRQVIDKDFYNKDEIDTLLQENINKSMATFKNCILQNQGYWPCLK